MSQIAPPIRALLFDFDGLIVDTETPSYESWNEIYRRHGLELDIHQWADVISNREADFDALANLVALLGGNSFDPGAAQEVRNRRKNELTDVTELLPGVRSYIDDARALGLLVGIASGSSRHWVTRHLERLGIGEGWGCIVCRDDVGRSKPHPDTYRTLLEGLGVTAGEAVALEDSPNGVISAQAAGIYCVAVPNTLTRHLDLTGADRVVSSLADVSLEDLLASASR